MQALSHTNKNEEENSYQITYKNFSGFFKVAQVLSHSCQVATTRRSINDEIETLSPAQWPPPKG
jgi:hypothetical protein